MNKDRLKSTFCTIADQHRKEMQSGMAELPAILNVPTISEFFSELNGLTHPMVR